MYRSASIVSISLWLACASFPALAIQSVARVNDARGLPEVLHGGKKIIEGHYVYFSYGKNDKWDFAGQKNELEVVSDYQYQVRGENRKFSYRVEKQISRSGEHAFSYQFDFDLTRDLPRIIGGGLEFHLDKSHNQELGKPSLLPDNRGWIWGSEDGKYFKFEFDNPVKSVFFESGNANRIRAYFFKDSVRKSKQKFIASFSFSEHTRAGLTDLERFGPADIGNWFSFDDPNTSPVDLSYLNHLPAGRHGFLQTDGDKLVFADGTTARFWGTNLAASALFRTSMVDIPGQARRLAALGFNLVRIHHHDSYWVAPNVFGNGATTTSQLDDRYMQYIDKWVAELNERGIYVWFDLHVQRYVTASDGITAFDEIDKKKPKQKGQADIKGYSYVNPSIQKAMETTNRQFLTRVNRFTGQKYADNPGIIALLLTNENDVTQHFGNRLLPPKNVPYHTERYQEDARAFADRWDLPHRQVWRSWEPGLAKIFLNDLEYRFNQRLITNLREYDGNHLVVTTNTWGRNPLYSLPALSSGDIIDVHTYGEIGALEKNPNVAANFTHWIASAQVTGKPVSVSEWNVEKFPVADRHASSLLMGARAAHQGWDAIMQFAYATQRPQRNGRAFNYGMYNDPAFLGTMPAAALMYRMEHVKPASKHFVFAPSAEKIMDQKISPTTSLALRTLTEIGRLEIALPGVRELPWLEASRIDRHSTIIRNPEKTIIPREATRAVSDTGELMRDWEQGIYTIDTPQTQAATGWIGGKAIELKDVVFDIETRSASVSVQSLDDRPISSSENIMISLAARALPKKPHRAPIMAEPVTGQISIRANPGLELSVTKNDSEHRVLSAMYEEGIYTIRLKNDLRSYWIFLRKSD